jgi:hypothetical protein
VCLSHYFFCFRTVRNWRPRRFGGGVGGRIAKDKKDDKPSAAISSASSTEMRSSDGMRIEERRIENRPRSRSRQRDSRGDYRRDGIRDRGTGEGGSSNIARGRSRSRDRFPGNNGFRQSGNAHNRPPTDQKREYYGSNYPPPYNDRRGNSRERR